MFKNILVPLDLSKKNKKPLDIAVKIGLSDNSKVNLLHVIETIADTTYTEFENFYQKLEKRAQNYMDSLITSYQSSQVEIEGKVVFGNRVQEILKYAADQRVDLIVMSSHKVNLENPAEGWGTISYKVGILSQCPVLLVK